MSATPFEPASQNARWPWAVLGAALAWEALVRVPLVLNAPVHLDSDLAVDGLTLLEAVRGQWRWHYPGTPYMGTPPVLLSLPQALVWGATPASLVSGGAVAWMLLTVSVFALAWRTFGPDVAGWSLVPLAFASTGAIWLSGRITGGHVLTVAWHAGAFALLTSALSRPGWRAAAALGGWCGLGLWLDSMFAVSLVGLLLAAGGGWGAAGVPRPVWPAGLAFALGLALGAAPREIGRRLDPYDAYPAQFERVRSREVLRQHAALFYAECLPRLVAGHRFPGYRSDPDPATLGSAAPLGARTDGTPSAIAATWAALGAFAVSLAALGSAALRPENTPQGAVAWGLLLSAGLVVVGFVINKNIYNADNYRYLVTMLAPAALGFGLAARWLWRRGRAAGVVAVALFAGLMTVDTVRWYSRLGWIDGSGRPVRRSLDYPALDWLNAHPDVRRIYAGYWDVYRLSFLTRGRVRGKPFAIFPDRFPEWTRGAAEEHPEVTIVTPGAGSALFVQEALRNGAEVLARGRGVAVLKWTAPVAQEPERRQPARSEW